MDTIVRIHGLLACVGRLARGDFHQAEVKGSAAGPPREHERGDGNAEDDGEVCSEAEEVFSLELQ